MSAALRVRNVGGLSAVVTITTPASVAVNVYSDAALQSLVSIPTTITADTTYYVATAGHYLLSVTVEGVEFCGQVVEFTAGTANSFALDPEPSVLTKITAAVETTADKTAGRLGTFAAASTLGTVIGKVQIFNTAGVSVGYLAIYDAVT